MSHFLARLVDRARGAAARVEPLIAPNLVFNFSADSAVAERQPEAPKKSPRESIPEKNPTPDANQGEKNVPRLEQLRPLVRQDGMGEAPTVEVVRESLLMPDQRPTEVEHAFVRQFPASPAEESESPPPSVSARKISTRQRKAEFAATRKTESAVGFSLPPNERDSEQPIVRVTIGRIEVRATPAPAPSRKIRKENPPRLSLDAYLKERKEGAR